MEQGSGGRSFAPTPLLGYNRGEQVPMPPPENQTPCHPIRTDPSTQFSLSEAIGLRTDLVSRPRLIERLDAEFTQAHPLLNVTSTGMGLSGISTSSSALLLWLSGVPPHFLVVASTPSNGNGEPNLFGGGNRK